MFKYRQFVFVIGFLATGVLACAQQAVQEETDSPAGPETAAIVKGFGISTENFGAFLEEAGAFPGSGVFFNGAWRDDAIGGSDAGTPPQAAVTVATQAEVYGYTPITGFGWRSGEQLYLSVPENAANDWSNTEAREKFKAMAVEFSQTYQPPFLFLANENSFYYEQDPEDYARFIDFYNETYDAIKAVSPGTQVGVVFNYEHLSGNGGFSGWTMPQWGALEAHDLSKLDVVGLTLYPWLGTETVASIPEDYLDALFARIDETPLAITETGWPGFTVDETPLAWEASAEAQVTYVDKLERMLAGRDVAMANWLWLYPPGAPWDNHEEWISFASLSLYDLQGERLPVYAAWEQFAP